MNTECLNKVVEKIKFFMNSSVIMRWDNISKSILVLILGGLNFIILLIWLELSYRFPAWQYWLNLEHYNFYYYLISFGCFIYFLLALIAYRFRSHRAIQTFMPYISTIYLAVTMMICGYGIGISSPATIAGYISLVTVGLVLYERKIIYITFIPITVFLLVAIISISQGKLEYAPIFSDELNSTILHENLYWVSSQLFLYIPIFFASILLFEILLIQWRNREVLINEISLKDPLTGIFNRRCIGKNLNSMQKAKTEYALVLLDLDHFKNINDQYGHDAGDQVLIQVAKILDESLRLQDSVGRFGGEEFILILPNNSLVQAMSIAERCRMNIEKMIVRLEDQCELRITASFGVAMSQQNLTKEDITRQADQALYLAKHKGRNQVRHYAEVQAQAIKQ